jgi:acetyltransferase-like isoleucine patch superfamily enzyme
MIIEKKIETGRIALGNNLYINSSMRFNPVGGVRSVLAIFSENGSIKIGDNTGMSNVVIGAFERIQIGANVSIGGGAKIFDSDFHSLSFSDRMQDPDTNFLIEPVIINDGAWIGTDVLVLKGVTIGKEAVVGAGSVVIKDVPAREVWAGNPAHFIKNVPEDSKR